MPEASDAVGSSTASEVTVNWADADSRHSDYWQSAVTVNNLTGAVWSIAPISSFTNNVLQSSVAGHLFFAKRPELFGHDLDGNLTNDGRWNYTWDAENRLVGMDSRTSVVPIQTLKFAYDWQGRRISKTVSNQVAGVWQLASDLRFVYDGWNLLAVLTSGLSPLTTFTWGLDLSGSLQGAGGVGGLLATCDLPSATTNFAAYDGNGNVMGLVNATNRTVSAKYEHGPFGELLRATGPMATNNPFRFSTKYQDDETDLLYYGFRYYNTSTGRWLSTDPFEEKGGVNLYGFVENSSMSYFDPSGLDVFLYFWNSSQGTSGSGHVGIGVGDKKSQDFYEANPKPSGVVEPMNPDYHQQGDIEFVIKNAEDYSKYKQRPVLVLQVKTCAEEDAKALKALQSWFASHPQWKLLIGQFDRASLLPTVSRFHGDFYCIDRFSLVAGLVVGANCADATKCGLRAIQIQTDTALTYSTPQDLAKALFDAYETNQSKKQVTILQGKREDLTKDNGTTEVLKNKVVYPAAKNAKKIWTHVGPGGRRSP